MESRNSWFYFFLGRGDKKEHVLYLCKILYLAKEFGLRLRKQAWESRSLALGNEQIEQKPFSLSILEWKHRYFWNYTEII